MHPTPEPAHTCGKTIDSIDVIVHSRPCTIGIRPLPTALNLRASHFPPTVASREIIINVGAWRVARKRRWELSLAIANRTWIRTFSLSILYGIFCYKRTLSSYSDISRNTLLDTLRTCIRHVDDTYTLCTRAKYRDSRRRGRGVSSRCRFLECHPEFHADEPFTDHLAVSCVASSSSYVHLTWHVSDMRVVLTAHSISLDNGL